MSKLPTSEQLRRATDRARVLQSDNETKDKALRAKNTRIEQLESMTPSGILTLYAQFKDFRRLHNLAHKIAFLADAQEGTVIDSDFVKRSSGASHRQEGLGTLEDRRRAAWVSKEITKLCVKIEDRLEVGKLPTDGGPRCRKRSCSRYGQRYSYMDTECTGTVTVDGEEMPCPTVFKVA